MAGYLQSALQRALSQHSAESGPGKVQHAQAAKRRVQPFSSAASSNPRWEAGASSDLVESAVAAEHPSKRPPTDGRHGPTNKYADAGISEAAGDAHTQLLTGSSTAMTEATAQRLINALNSHHRSLEEASQTLSEASRQLRDGCLLLNRHKHRL